MKFLLDTDHLSILQNQTQPEFSAISARMGQHAEVDLAFSIVSFHEQVLGGHTYINRARDTRGIISGYKKLSKVLNDFSTVLVLPFDGAAAAEFDRLVAQKVRIGTMDLRIASIALARGLVLLTRNTVHFGKVPGLVYEDWTV